MIVGPYYVKPTPDMDKFLSGCESFDVYRLNDHRKALGSLLMGADGTWKIWAYHWRPMTWERRQLTFNGCERACEAVDPRKAR